LESKVTGASVSPDTLMRTPHGVMGSAPRMDQACRLRRSWRSSRLPTSMGSHQSSLPFNATACTHATWTALTLSDITPYVLICVQSLASVALAFVMHRSWCSLNVRCASIQMPSEHVGFALNRMDLFPTLIFLFSIVWRGFLWPGLCVNSAASVFAVSN
jgi:hypothetical protein